jgi:hypothetical protein
MLSKFGKNYHLISYTLYLSLIIFTGCSNLAIDRNDSDYFGDAMESKGNELDIESLSITERLAQMMGSDSSINLDASITFEVALNQFSIMPLLSVDRVGGIIITDWYSASANTNERVKFNVIIKDELMTNESIDIFMFKETFNGTSWVKADASISTSNKIKELILNKSNRLKATAELS